MTLALAAAAAAAMLAVPAAAQDRAWTSPEELARLGAEAHAACAMPGTPPGAAGMLIDHATWLAGLTRHGDIPCAPRPELAMRMARAVAAARTSNAARGHLLLARFYEAGAGVAANPIAARRHRELAWLLGAFIDGEKLFATRADEDAFLARPESIGTLEPYAEVEEMRPAHLNLARGLFARRRRADAARIETLLGSGFQSHTEAQLLRARSALRYGDAAARAQAATQLRPLVRNAASTEARALLMPVVQRQLRSRVPGERWEAIESLAAFAHGGEPPALSALEQAVRAANGGRPTPMLRTGPNIEAIRQRLRAPMNGEDYPASALRAELQGRIALRGLIDPRGKLIHTEPLFPGQPPVLLNTTRNIYARRRLPPVDLGRHRTAPYVWIELPGVRYVLPEED